MLLLLPRVITWMTWIIVNSNVLARGPPIISNLGVKTSAELKVKIQSNVSLLCVYYSPDPNKVDLAWLREVKNCSSNRNITLSDTKRMKIIIEPHGNHRVTRLNIVRVDRTDEALYTCRVNNTAGARTAATRLIVVGDVIYKNGDATDMNSDVTGKNSDVADRHNCNFTLYSNSEDLADEYSKINYSDSSRAISNGTQVTGYIIIPASHGSQNLTLNHTSSQKYSIIGSAVAISLLITLVTLMTICIKGRFKKKFAKVSHDEQVDENQTLELAVIIPQIELDSCWSISSDRLEIYELLGEGYHGRVYKGAVRLDEHPKIRTVVAVKTLKVGQSIEEMTSFKREIEMMSRLEANDNLIKFYGYCNYEGSLVMLVEFANGGSLKQCLTRCNYRGEADEDSLMDYLEPLSVTDSRTAITQQQLHSFSYQIARGMAFLASKKIVHRDLAARNVLVSNNSQKFVLKIADFGLTRNIDADRSYYQPSCGGFLPVKWMAPECLRGNKYTTKSDVWSYGVTLWEIYSLGSDPYPELPPQCIFEHVIDNGLRMHKPIHADHTVYSIMTSCWESEARDRPDFSALVCTLDRLVCESANRDYLSMTEDVDYVMSHTAETDDVFTEDSKHDTPSVTSIDSQYHTMPLYVNANRHNSETQILQLM